MITLNDFIIIARRQGKPNDSLFVNLLINDFGVLFPCKIEGKDIILKSEEFSLSLIDQLMNSRVDENLSSEIILNYENKIFKVNKIDFFENKVVLVTYLEETKNE